MVGQVGAGTAWGNHSNLDIYNAVMIRGQQQERFQGARTKTLDLIPCSEVAIVF